MAKKVQQKRPLHTCSARPSLLLILALMVASVCHVVLLRIAFLLWIINNKGLGRSLLPKIYTGLSGGFDAYTEASLEASAYYRLEPFVNKKKLVSGDAVLFLRGEDGELRLGVRRGSQVRGDCKFPDFSRHKFNANSIHAVVSAISTNNVFHISYNHVQRWFFFRCMVVADFDKSPQNGQTDPTKLDKKKRMI